MSNGDLQQLAQEVGELKGRLGAVETATREQHKDIKAILKTLNQARGGWKTLLLVAGIGRLRGVGDQGINHYRSTAAMKRHRIPF